MKMKCHTRLWNGQRLATIHIFSLHFDYTKYKTLQYYAIISFHIYLHFALLSFICCFISFHQHCHSSIVYRFYGWLFNLLYFIWIIWLLIVANNVVAIIFTMFTDGANKRLAFIGTWYPHVWAYGNQTGSNPTLCLINSILMCKHISHIFAGYSDVSQWTSIRLDFRGLISSRFASLEMTGEIRNERLFIFKHHCILFNVEFLLNGTGIFFSFISINFLLHYDVIWIYLFIYLVNCSRFWHYLIDLHFALKKVAAFGIGLNFRISFILRFDFNLIWIDFEWILTTRLRTIWFH